MLLFDSLTTQNQIQQLDRLISLTLESNME